MWTGNSSSRALAARMASTRLLALPRRTLASDSPGTRESSRDGPQKRQSQGQLVVELPRRPPNYLLSPGVPLVPPQITLPNDSTAYIIERILLPPTEVSEYDGKPMPKKMTYIIGWRDLPAARRLVPAMEIMDYVSPRELEDWECRLEQELDDVRETLVEEQRLENEYGKSKSTAIAVPVDPKTGKRKRGRPPAHSQIEPGATVELEGDGETSKARFKGGALSLSTPKKSRLKDFEGLSDDDASPSRQLEKELYDYDMGSARYEAENLIEETGVESEGGYTGDELPANKLPSAKDVIEDYTSTGPLTSASASAKPSPTSQETATAASAWAAFGLKNSFTPISKSLAAASVGSTPVIHGLTSQKTPSQGPVSTKQMEHSPTPTKSQQQKSEQKKPAARTKKKRKEPETGPVDENGEAVWVVKCLEDHGLFEVEGETDLKRYFKVRWEGDWPKDQNPSWEPEENLPANLVRNYLKAGKKRRKVFSGAADTTKRKNLKQTTLLWLNSTQYSSVSEAFAGEDIMNDGMRQGADMPVEPNLDDKNDGSLGLKECENGNGNERGEYFVVDEDADPLGGSVVDWRGNARRIHGYS